MEKKGKVDFFEGVNYGGSEPGKFLTNWVNTLKKKKKIVIDPFQTLVTKSAKMEFPVFLKMVEEGFFRIHDDKNNIFYFKCHPYDEMDIDAYSVISGTDEFLYKFNQKGEACLKGIMEAEIIEKKVEETPRPNIVPESKSVKQSDTGKNLEEILQDKFGAKLDDNEMEELLKVVMKALQCKSMDDFIKLI